VKLSIGIKALNEERHIAAAIESALRAAAPFEGEVILADSGSTDRTVEIARQFPIRIVQLAHPAERRCGAGAQLAYQFAHGEYFYLLDGDMILDPDFIPAAMDYLRDHPEVAAVAGRVEEKNVSNQEFRIRENLVRTRRNWLPGLVDQLDGGGLYRTAAISEAGYFSDRNLHGFEEFDLAARLRHAGWKLARVDRTAVDHFGHTSSGYRLMWRRIRSGYSGASGEVFRAALGRPHMPIVLRKLGHIRNGAIVIGWWLALLASMAFSAFGVTTVLFLLPFVLLALRRRSLSLGIYSCASWNANAWGLISGFFRPRVSPLVPLAAIDLSPAPATASVKAPEASAC
jgi:glycosyltransferase involved in cell wall biosynthesis